MLIIVISITDQVIMRQTKSLVHFEILYVYSKSFFEFSLFFEQSLSSGFELFFDYVSESCIGKRTESFLWGKNG